MSINYETGLPGKLGKSSLQINYHRSQKNSSDTRKHKNPKLSEMELLGHRVVWVWEFLQGNVDVDKL